MFLARSAALELAHFRHQDRDRANYAVNVLFCLPPESGVERREFNDGGGESLVS